MQSHNKRKNSLEDSLIWVLFAAERDFREFVYKGEFVYKHSETMQYVKN